MTETADAVESVQLPQKLEGLFKPSRYKIVYGGRGAAKSYSFARALLIQAAEKPLRVLCTREVQKSIRDSVHRVLSDHVEVLGLSDFFTVLDNEIRGENGSLFIFSGLSDHTVESIKSFEGIDICWCEEAQVISKRSWSVLIPTIRNEGSEIWISLNPELDTDETYVRFVLSPPPGAQVIEVSYRDNPWFPSVLEDERQHCLKTAPDDYDNIWEGKPRKAVAGAIYAKEITLAYAEKRITRVLYDHKLKVHTVWDLGMDNNMSIGLFQKGRAEFRMIGMLQGNQRKIHEYAGELNGLNLNWGWDWLPHDGFINDYKAPSAYSILRSFGRRVKPKVGTKLPIPNVPIETGIKAARGIFHMLVMDEEKCALFIEAAKRYRRSINPQTQQPGAPVHDQYSDPMDMLRYFALSCDKMTNDEEQMQQIPQKPPRPFDPGTGAL